MARLSVVNTMKIYPTTIVILVITGSIASYMGARFAAKRLSSDALKKIFGLVIVVMTFYRLIRFFI